MVLTRACKMDSGKSNNGAKNTETEKSKMKSDQTNSLNTESEESWEYESSDDESDMYDSDADPEYRILTDEPNTNLTTSVPPGLAGSSIKVTLKKTRSSSSSSSRESTQSFEVVRSVVPVSESVSGGEDGVEQKESENKKTSYKQNSEEKEESEEESQNANSSVDENDIEILSSDDSQESFAERSSPALSVKNENKDEKNIPSLNTVVHLKTEVPQNSTMVKSEDCKIKIKSLKEELFKEEATVNTENDIVVLKDDDDDDDENNASKQLSNGVEKKEQVKEQKFKVNVRSFDDLVAPRTLNLINMTPGQIDTPPNFLSQNGGPFPSPFITMSCDVCGIQFDSSDLLNEHKLALKHYKCSFKECENLVISNQQEYLDHQRLIHNIMPSPVQQLAHQVQRLPTMGFDQQLQSGVPQLRENLAPPPGVPSMYTPLRMPNQPVPMQRPMRPMMRPNMAHMMSSRGRNISRASRGRPVTMGSNMVRCNVNKRPLAMPLRQTPPVKRVTTDRNSHTNNLNRTPKIVKSLSESLTKSLTSANKSPVAASQQDVVNLFSKRGLTISTVDKVNNINLPAGISLNSAVSIIPTSPLKSVDTVDLTGPDKPREKKFWPCEICSKTYTSIETLYDHISNSHKSILLPYKCNLCSSSFPNSEILNRHKQSFHKSEVNTNIPFVIPILDFTKAGTIAKLQAMGVTNYVPVAQLDNQGGQFGIPIMSVSRPGSVDGLKYTNFFNLGCVRKL